MTTFRSALWLPLFDELADARAVAEVAALAEEAGWDGLFVWDHVRWQAPVRGVADPWVTLAAAVMATERLQLGPMVTPLARRRPAMVARQAVTLDRLSGGRLTLGVGIGSDRFGEEFSRFGDETDDRKRAEMTDEALAVLRTAWSGETVDHHGTHYTVDQVEFLPRPVHPRGIPIWIAGFPGKLRPRRRAARHEGFFPVNVTHPDELAEAVDAVTTLRTAELQNPETPADFGTGAETYDVAVALEPGTDPAGFVRAGATWCLTETDPDKLRLADIRAMVADGPFR